MNTLKRLTLKLNYEELDIELNEQNFLAKQVLKNSNYHSQNQYANNIGSLRKAYLGEKGIYTAFANINNRLLNKRCVHENSYNKEELLSKGDKNPSISDLK